MAEFTTFEVERPANGFERGWYFRMRDSLYNEPIGPFSSQREAEQAAAQLMSIYKGY